MSAMGELESDVWDERQDIRRRRCRCRGEQGGKGGKGCVISARAGNEGTKETARIGSMGENRVRTRLGE